MEVPVIGVFTSALQVFVLSIGLGMIVRNVNRTENVVASVTDRLVKNGLGIFLMGVAMLIWSAFRFGHLEGVAMWTAGGIIADIGLYLDAGGSGSKGAGSKSPCSYMASMAVFNSYTLTCFVLPWAVFGDCVLKNPGFFQSIAEVVACFAGKF